MGKPKVKEQKPTAVEQQLFQISQDRLRGYERAKPFQNELTRRMTGRRWDEAAQQWVVDPSAGVIGEDGQPIIDNGRAMAKAQQQWEPLLQNYNPNSGTSRTGRVGMLGDMMESQGGLAGGLAFQQQSGYLDALGSVAQQGRGQMAGTTSAYQNQAGTAAQVAARDALASFKGNVANQNAVQGLLGLGTTGLMSQVQTRRPDGSYIRGAYDNALTGLLGGSNASAGFLGGL